MVLQSEKTEITQKLAWMRCEGKSRKNRIEF